DGGILALPLDSIERTHPLDRLPGDLGSGLLRVDDLSFHMRPTPSARDCIADHSTVVASIAIPQHNLPVICPEALRAIAAAIHREGEDVVRLRLVANLNPHARIRNFIFALHGHD